MYGEILQNINISVPEALQFAPGSGWGCVAALNLLHTPGHRPGGGHLDGERVRRVREASLSKEPLLVHRHPRQVQGQLRQTPHRTLTVALARVPPTSNDSIEGQRERCTSPLSALSPQMPTQRPYFSLCLESLGPEGISA